ncbi:hypothetical protein NB311A_13056 [Nitrobacter sp. Nb-311A]|nr:hypothetical protein NB311A_13056 [Nitrobacter sp. Nb-311A]
MINVGADIGLNVTFQLSLIFLRDALLMCRPEQVVRQLPDWRPLLGAGLLARPRERLTSSQNFTNSFALGQRAQHSPARGFI